MWHFLASRAGVGGGGGLSSGSKDKVQGTWTNPGLEWFSNIYVFNY